MERLFNIGEIAGFFQIPASTLRYWEETGVISPGKNPENNYREYSVSDLMIISDVLFYKNLGLPLKQIRNMEQITPEDQEKLFAGKIRELKNQQQEIENRIQKLQNRLRAFEMMKELKRNPFSLEDIDTECIVTFELIEIEKLHKYIGNPYLYSRVQHSKEIDREQRGLTVSGEESDLIPDEKKLWKKGKSKYVTCLMKEEITDGYPNNLEELVEQVQKTYKTGYIISRFLLCAQEDGKLYDFYKTYIEILP
ncbi:MAG: MerR family transcriptional regulator [Clostridiales bacterium]|nr:MerR family transcriptional regulator [Clostridiales bacterium]